MKLSQDQQNISDAWLNDNSNLIVDAVAGSGKSTMLQHLISLQRKKTLYLAFNRSIQKEMELKFKAKNLNHAKSVTLHSLGNTALQAARTTTLDNNFKWDLIKKWQRKKENRAVFRKITFKEKVKLSFFFIDLHETSRLFYTTDLKECVEHNLSLGKPSYNYSYLGEDFQKLWDSFLRLREENYKSSNIKIDFTDMIYLPVALDLDISLKPKYLMIDEAQDLSYLQHLLIDKIIAQPQLEKWIAVGDKRQSIYNFCGAFSNSIDRYADKENTVSLPLHICYRCPVSVIKEANQVYNVMKGFKEEKGKVHEVEDISLISPRSLVICRNTEPLVSLYLELLALDKPCYIRGEDILNNITRFLNNYKEYDFVDLEKYLSLKMESLEDSKKEETRLEYHILKENYKIFIKLARIFSSRASDVKTLLKELKTLFVKKDNAIVLATIHKSKGLEADIVYILNEDKTIPSKFAKTKEQLQQEENLRYVARTRARKEMYYLNL